MCFEMCWSVFFAFTTIAVLVSTEVLVNDFPIRTNHDNFRLTDDPTTLIAVTLQFPPYQNTTYKGFIRHPSFSWKVKSACSGQSFELYLSNGDTTGKTQSDYQAYMTPENVGFDTAYNITIHLPLGEMRRIVNEYEATRCSVFTFGFYQLFRKNLTIEKSSEINISFYEDANITSISDPIAVTLLENQNNPVNLYCNVTGFPTPEIEWSRPETDGLIGTASTFKSPDGWLNLTTVDKGHVGEYICTVKGYDNTVRKSTQLSVQYKPIVDIVGSFRIKQKLRYNAEQSCNAHAEPGITEYYWYWIYEDEPHTLENQRRINLTSEASPYTEPQIKHAANHSDIPRYESGNVKITLIIKAVEKDDYKKRFYCVFKNSVGMAENYFLVGQSDKPELVNGVTASYTPLVQCCEASQITLSGVISLVIMLVHYLTLH